jgi:hypothetical protein
VRRRPVGLQRRRRGQGGGDLPGPQGHPDRDRHRGRGPLQRRAAGHHRARGPPELAFVLTTVVGHLFGYEAALAIDAQALPLREARGAIEDAVSVPDAPDADRLLTGLRPVFEPIAARFNDGLRSGAYNGHLEAGTAVRLASMFRYATGVVPLDAYQVEHGRVGTPSQVIEDLTAALTAPSRSSPAPSTPSSTRPRPSPWASPGPTRACSTCRSWRPRSTPGAARDRLSYKALRTLAGLDAAVEPRWWATPATASRATWRATPPSWWWTGAASPATCRCAPSATRSCAAPSTGWPPSARSPWRWAAATAAAWC